MASAPSIFSFLRTISRCPAPVRFYYVVGRSFQVYQVGDASDVEVFSTSSFLADEATAIEAQRRARDA